MVLLHFDEQPPIVQAIFAGAIDDVKLFIDNKHDVNTIDPEKRTPLHAAAFKGDAAIASVLLLCGARVNAKDSKWITPLHRACSMGAEKVVELLLRYQANVSARDRLWQTPLHVAAANDAYHCVEQLLDHIPNVNVTDRAGRTALHHAAANGHNMIVDLLISRGCIVNACDKKDCRPLHCAVQMGHLVTVELLLQNGADINAKDRNQYTPLHVAASTGNVTICRYLLNAGAEVDAQNAFLNTPLHLACLNGHAAICEELANFDASLEPVNARGQTPLHIAAASTHGVECLTYLVMQDLDINKQSLDGRTPLHMTAIHGRFTRSKTLIDEGAIIDCKDKNGMTPLHIAAQYGHDLLAITLLSHGANPSERGHEGRTPLHMCCLSGYVECCRKFLQVGVDLNALDDTGKTPIHCAAYKGSAECLDLLVSNGANFLINDKIGRLPLHYAASQGHYQCLFTLVGIGSPTNAQDSEGCTPLHLASAYDLAGKCVEYLLQHKADPLIKNNRGFTALHYAVSWGNSNAVNSLLSTSECPKIFQLEDLPDVTPLHLAAKLDNIDIIRTILSFYSNVNIQTEKGITPLILAAREGHTQCVHNLLRFGANVAVCDNVNNMTAIHYSAKNGHSCTLSSLLHNSEDKSAIDKVDKHHRTALMLAVSGNHTECVESLLKCGANPNILDKDKHSALFRAVFLGQNNIVELLLRNKAVPNIIDNNGKTVLHLAAACGHLICLQTLMGYMTDDEVKILDHQQCSILHWACYTEVWKCLEFILEAKIFKSLEGNQFSAVHCAAFSGSEKCLELLVKVFGSQIVQKKDARQRTPLHIAALHGHAECAKYLIDQGAVLEAVDEDSRTPFIAAAQYGQSQVVDLLLSHQVDKTATDKQGNTALHWSCLKKHNYTALLILENSNDSSITNITNNEKKTPLHLSARNGLVDVTRELLRRGSSVLAVDNDGLTPALCCAPNNNVAQCLGLILQNLPEIISTTTSIENGPPSLKSLHELMYITNPSVVLTKTHSCQTELTLVNDPDQFEVKRIFKSPKPVKTVYTHEPKSDLYREANCFLIETDDFKNECPPDKNKTHGFNLHKSYSNISIACNGGFKCERGSSSQRFFNEISEKKKNCRECFRLQHRCPDCTMRYLIRLRIHGKTSNTKSFKDYLTKTLNEASFEYRQKFIQAVESLQKEINTKDFKNPVRKSSAIKLTKSHSLESSSCSQTSHAKQESPVKLKATIKRKDDNIIVNDIQSLIYGVFNDVEKYCSSSSSNSEDPVNNDELLLVTENENNCASCDSSNVTVECYSNKSIAEGSSDVKNNADDSVFVESESNTESLKDFESTSSDNKFADSENAKALFNPLTVDLMKYIKSAKLGTDRVKDEEYFKALSSYMNYMLQKFDRDFELQKELEQNYKSCAKYQEINKEIKLQMDTAKEKTTHNEELENDYFPIIDCSVQEIVSVETEGAEIKIETQQSAENLVTVTEIVEDKNKAEEFEATVGIFTESSSDEVKCKDGELFVGKTDIELIMKDVVEEEENCKSEELKKDIGDLEEPIEKDNEEKVSRKWKFKDTSCQIS